ELFMEVTGMQEAKTFNTTPRLTSLPTGWREARCPSCGSRELAGAIITPTADDLDPNILCQNCQWFD
ncbi:MAG: hypothetical protein ACREDR_03935, partial [Blastocatellia bacterium]